MNIFWQLLSALNGRFDYKKAFKNFIQLFLLGNITLFVLSVGLGLPYYGFKSSLSHALDLGVFHPVFSFISCLIAVPIAYIRGVKPAVCESSPRFKAELEKLRRGEITIDAVMFDDPGRIPPGLFVVGFAFLLFFLIGVFVPDSEVSQAEISDMRDIVVNSQCEPLIPALDNALADGKVLASERREFLNTQMFAELNNECVPYNSK